jgi:hypothetical protein
MSFRLEPTVPSLHKWHLVVEPVDDFGTVFCANRLLTIHQGTVGGTTKKLTQFRF